MKKEYLEAGKIVTTHGIKGRFSHKIEGRIYNDNNSGSIKE